MSLNVLNISSPLEAMPAEAESAISIKGFASVSVLDRDRELVVDPRVFDIPTFMASPTLMVNHRFLKDEFGNDVVAGKVTYAVPAYVKQSTDSEHVVYAIENDEKIDVISKSISPRLQPGDKGLFIRAEVRHPIAKDMVAKGELGGLSWRGFTRKSQALCEGTPCKLISKVDLVEISLVHHPNQPQSTFMIAKSIDGEAIFSSENLSEYPVYGLRFRKSRYPSAAAVRECMKSYALDVVEIGEDENSYVAYTAAANEFEVEKSISISIGEVEALSAPERSQDELIGVHVGKLQTHPVEENPMSESVDTAKRLRLYLLNEQGLLARFPGLMTQSMKSVVTTDGEEIEILTLELPESPAEPIEKDEPVAVEKEVPVVDWKSDFENLQAQLKEMKELLAVRHTEVEKPAEIKVEPAPEPNAIEKMRADLEAATAKYTKFEHENQELRETLKSLVDRFNSQVPSHAARDERVESSKSLDGANPRDLVGSVVARAFSNAR